MKFSIIDNLRLRDKNDFLSIHLKFFLLSETKCCPSIQRKNRKNPKWPNFPTTWSAVFVYWWPFWATAVRLAENAPKIPYFCWQKPATVQSVQNSCHNQLIWQWQLHNGQYSNWSSCFLWMWVSSLESCMVRFAP